MENDETATIPCIPINEYYQCTPTLSSLSLGQTYSIYYHDNLDALLATGVTIELASDSTVINNIYSLSLPNDDICTTSVFNAVIVRTDAQITKESTAQIQIKKEKMAPLFKQKYVLLMLIQRILLLIFWLAEFLQGQMSQKVGFIYQI